jgi:anti-sigma regulatory factor (Ser/Thr protein kinase)
MFPNAPGGVRDARCFVADALRDADPDVRDAAVLMVSELATNAVVHTSSSFDVGIDQFDHEVRVSVTDQGEGTPRLRRARPSDCDGRGLGIVAAFAVDWGVDQGPRSKTVWFTVPVSKDGRAVGRSEPTER